MIRSILGILAGHAVFSAAAAGIFGLGGLDPHKQPALGILAVSTGIGFVASGVGGYITALVARRRQVLHGVILTAILSLEALASILAQPGADTYWSQIATLAIMAPAATLGSWLRSRWSPSPGTDKSSSSGQA